METLLVLAVGFVSIASFLIGVKVGQTVAKGEEVKLLEVKPVEAEPEQQPPQELTAEELTRLEVIAQNIDNYDGTDQGQKDVPWR